MGILKQQKGIDVSKWQANIDYAKAKKEIDFVIIRCGHGAGKVDRYFMQNYHNAKSENIPVGAYWYSTALTKSQAKLEAKAFLKAVSGLTFEFPLYVDIEEPEQFKKGKKFVNDIIRVFCDTLEDAGYYAGVYMSCSPAKQYVSRETYERYDLWIAQYSNKLTYPDKVGMWQFTSNGRIAGIKGDVDMNLCYKDYKAIMERSGLNGFKRK